MTQTRLSCSDLRLDGGTQMRANLDGATTADYAALLQDGAQFPPVVVFYDGADYWLADGFHRIHAHRLVHLDTIDCQVYSGTRIDAIKFALQANAANGRPRSDSDLKRAYRVAVDNDLCAAYDVTAVKTLLRCSTRWARTLTADARDIAEKAQAQLILKGAEDGKTQREIAAELDISQRTVGRTLQNFESKRKSSVLTQTPDHPPDDPPNPPARPPVRNSETPEELARSDALQAMMDQAMIGLAKAQADLAEWKATTDMDYPFLDKDHPWVIAMKIHEPMIDLIGRMEREHQRITAPDRKPIPVSLQTRMLERIGILHTSVIESYSNWETFHD